MRSFTAIRKETGGFCGSFLLKGGVFAYAGLIQNLKDLQDFLGSASDLKDLKTPMAIPSLLGTCQLLKNQ